MRFTYKAQRASGEVYEATQDFDSKDALYNALHSERSSLISVSEAKKVDMFATLKTFSLGGRIKEEQKILFARNLGAMINAGLPLSRALGVMERQAKSKKLKKLVADLIQGITAGRPLSDMLAKYPQVFSPLFVSMIRAGEESGNIVGAFKVVSDQLERSYRLKKKVKGAMMYPGIILSAMFLIGILMMMFVVPTLTATFVELGVDLPLSTRIVIFISDFLKNNIITSFLLIILTIVGVVFYAKSENGKRTLGKLVLKIPIIGFLVKEVNSARTASTLSSLLIAGVEVVRSIEITESVMQNVHYKKVLKTMKEKIKTGGLMSEVFKENEYFYPPLVGELTAVGEETGKLSDLLQEVAVFYEADVEEKTKNMSTIIEPFLMIIIGAAVGFFALSMITPMYSLTSAI